MGRLSRVASLALHGVHSSSATQLAPTALCHDLLMAIFRRADKRCVYLASELGLVQAQAGLLEQVVLGSDA